MARQFGFEINWPLSQFKVGICLSKYNKFLISLPKPSSKRKAIIYCFFLIFKIIYSLKAHLVFLALEPTVNVFTK